MFSYFCRTPGTPVSYLFSCGIFPAAAAVVLKFSKSCPPSKSKILLYTVTLLFFWFPRDQGCDSPSDPKAPGFEAYRSSQRSGVTSGTIGYKGAGLGEFKGAIDKYQYHTPRPGEHAHFLNGFSIFFGRKRERWFSCGIRQFASTGFLVYGFSCRWTFAVLFVI